MSRARIAALALVNWKGVFYERYLLDRHVTALEGANGAGKTTVMIAAYVALLPDLTRLRFTNLGESGATGGDRGIWGRLGEPGRPSYAVLDLELADGERLLAGVRLARAAEPTVELTTFIASGLAPAVRLSDILLVRGSDGDQVPELDEVGAAIGRAGGALEVFRTSKEYFAALFERGATPMRLATDEERGKLNEMLRTSMTGGISRALTSELRGFLLKEETGLGDTLSRMRANLDGCRRTRTEVAESRNLEREISAIYEAGLAMFGAALHASRAAAAEAERQARAAQVALDAAVDDERRLGEHLEATLAQEAGLEGRLAAARAAHAAAIAARDHRAAVQAVTARKDALERELAGLDGEAARARASQAAAIAARTAAQAERERARSAYDRAAFGLAHLREGLDELVRRAHAHRQLGRRLDEARALLDRPALTAAEAEAALADSEQARAAAEIEQARLSRDARDLDVRRDEHAEAMRALIALEDDGDGHDGGREAAGREAGGREAAGREAAGREGAGRDGAATPLSPHARARAALVRFAAREVRLGRHDELARELRDAERLAGQQRAARALATELGLAVGAPGAAAAVAVRLDAVEAALRAAEDELRASAPGDAGARQDALRAAIAACDQRGARWQLATAAAARLTPTGQPPTNRAEVGALRDRLTGDHLGLEQRRAALERAREELQREVAILESGAGSGASIDPELVRLRDHLGAELLASRFEDLELDDAAWVEARLGPLAGALIVEDPEAAARTLAATERDLPTVWLVGAGAELDLAREGADAEGDGDPDADVISRERFGLRVSRRVARPTLGRRARARQIDERRVAITAHTDELEALGTRARALAGWRRDVELLAAEIDLLAAGDPAIERARLESEQATLGLAEQARRARAQTSQAQALAARRARDGLRRLLADAALLEAPDHDERRRDLAAAIDGLGAARVALARRAPARDALAPLIEVLRQPPPDDAAVAVGATRLRALAALLDRLFQARAALEDVVAHRHAADWSDAAAALDDQAALAPALEQQHRDARDAVAAAEAADAATETAWEAATAGAQDAEGRRAAAAAHRDRAVAELVALGAGAAMDGRHDGSDDGGGDAERGTAERAVDRAATALATLEGEARALVARRALAGERHDHAVRLVVEARAAATAELRRGRPAGAAWAELRARADSAGLLQPVLAGDAQDGKSSVQLVAEAASKRELLLDRLGAALTRARGDDELVALVRAGADGPGYLETWLAVREWLRRRVPAQVAEVDDPLLALERLRDHLGLLEGRLARQEGDLRGASEDVARGIDVQLRRAAGQVRRLNQQLDGIRFGSIHGIRIEMRRVDRMEQILRALRQGEAQELLFLSSMPIEEALDEIFRRYGAGRSGGQRLLDYREYLELVVEIRRQGADAWELASPTRLSTGEAIGVGAALMMVVLTEWERDANLLRARRSGGSLRFLFLDEANRLSRDNLGVLFDLCRNLDLQLLIAAPEVARAEGNTTYRLVRHLTDDGREEVIVSGRRVAPGAEAPATEATTSSPSSSTTATTGD